MAAPATPESEALPALPPPPQHDDIMSIHSAVSTRALHPNGPRSANKVRALGGRISVHCQRSLCVALAHFDASCARVFVCVQFGFYRAVGRRFKNPRAKAKAFCPHSCCFHHGYARIANAVVHVRSAHRDCSEQCTATAPGGPSPFDVLTMEERDYWIEFGRRRAVAALARFGNQPRACMLA
jgi:hypothetical protein